MAKFKVGDRVRVVRAQRGYEHLNGKEGIVIEVGHPVWPVGVRFGEKLNQRPSGRPDDFTAYELGFDEPELEPITDINTRAKEATSKLISNCTPREKADKCPA